MTKNELLTELLQRVDAPLHEFSRLDAYYNGQAPLAYIAPEAREALGNRMQVLSSNICRLAVTSLAERLRITGFRTAEASRLWEAWRRNDLDQTAALAHREALALGRAYVIVWGDARGALVTVESARQMAVKRDPATREVVAAVKRWQTDKTTEAVLFEPDTITRFRSNSIGATTLGFETVETLRNPFGEVMVTELANADRVLDVGVSEMADLLPLQDFLSKTLADAAVASEYYARPKRFATGVELGEDENGNPVNPFSEGVKMLVSEDPNSRFGSLPAADLGAYEAAVRVITSQVMAVSGLPAHYIGALTNQPTSADALRAAEAGLTARAEARQAVFGRAWERVARQILAVELGRDPGVFDVSVVWADPATRSMAQEADAVMKLHQVGLLPASWALKRLGYTSDDIAEIEAARAAETASQAVADVRARVDLATALQGTQGLSQNASLAAAGLFAAAAENKKED